MFSKSLLSIGLLSAAIPAATANFLIFAVTNNDINGAYNQFLLFNNPPDCNDAANAIPLTTGYDNDASSGGAACDGCDIGKNTQDWDITRLEFYDGSDAIGSSTDNPQPLTSGGLGHLTLYEDRGYAISYVSLDGSASGTAGTCTRNSDQYLDGCPAGLSVTSGYEIFSCETDLTIIPTSAGGASPN